MINETTSSTKKKQELHSKRHQPRFYKNGVTKFSRAVFVVHILHFSPNSAKRIVFHNKVTSPTRVVIYYAWPYPLIQQGDLGNLFLHRAASHLYFKRKEKKLFKLLLIPLPASIQTHQQTGVWNLL